MLTIDIIINYSKYEIVYQPIKNRLNKLKEYSAT